MNGIVSGTAKVRHREEACTREEVKRGDETRQSEEV